MELEFSLSRKDFINYQLFLLSRTEGFKKKRKNNWILPPIYCVIIGILLLFYKGLLFLMIFLVFGVFWIIFYPFYSKWYYKFYFFKLIGKRYKNRINLAGRVTIKDREIHLSDETGETDIEVKEVKELVDVKNYVFVTFNSGMTIILPKDKIDSIHLESFVQELEQLTNITRTDMPEWEWK